MTARRRSMPGSHEPTASRWLVCPIAATSTTMWLTSNNGQTDRQTDRCVRGDIKRRRRALVNAFSIHNVTMTVPGPSRRSAGHKSSYWTDSRQKQHEYHRSHDKLHNCTCESVYSYSLKNIDTKTSHTIGYDYAMWRWLRVVKLWGCWWSASRYMSVKGIP